MSNITSYFILPTSYLFFSPVSEKFASKFGGCNMRIDLTCPVELWHFRMPTAESPFCTVQLYNLSDKTVVSIQACYLCYDQDGEQTARHVERVQGLEAPTRCAFEMSVKVEEGIDASGMELLVEKVWFEDGTVWRRGVNPPAQFRPSPLLQGQQSKLNYSLSSSTCISSLIIS